MTRYPTLPESYECAEWRCTLPIDPVAQATGIGFTKPDGSVIRLMLSVEDSRQLAESLTEYLADYDALSHSDNSSGNPSADGSPNEGQKQ